MLNWKSMFSKGNPTVGIDVGSSGLRLVELKDTSGGPVLTNLAWLHLPRGVVVQGELLEKDTLSRKLSELVSSCKCSRKSVVTCLSGNSVTAKKVNFNQMAEEELRELLRDEGAKYLPFDDLSSIYLDFQVLKPSDVNPGQVEVLIVAAKKDLVDSYTSAFQKAGLEVVIMDVDSYALETMYEHNYDYDDDEVVALIDIGASTTNINLVKGGMSIFTRAFSQGGNVITEAIQQERGASFEEAELNKRGGNPADALQEEKWDSSILLHAEPIIQEIEGTLDYIKFQSRETVTRIMISGGSAAIGGLDRALAGRLNVETQIVNPFRKIKIDSKTVTPEKIAELTPSAAVAVGLALRRAGDK